MSQDFDPDDYPDAPTWLRQAESITANCLGRLRRARNQGLASDHDVEEAREARDLIRRIIRRGGSEYA